MFDKYLPVILDSPFAVVFVQFPDLYSDVRVSLINARCSSKGPLIETASGEVQAIEVVRHVGNEIVMGILDEPGLHPERRKKTLIEARAHDPSLWANSTLISTKPHCSKLMEYLVSPPRRRIFLPPINTL